MTTVGYLKLVQLLKSGKVAVMPTDTIYGIVGSALFPETVENIYRLRKRATDKPFIILIHSLNDLNHFNITLTEKKVKFLEKIWPNPVSIVLPCGDAKLKYLHRGKNSLAFRMPKDEKLMEILKSTGPLVAPSANFEGEKPSETIDEAKKYFRDKVAFYLDRGRINSQPSTLIKLNNNGSYEILREGDFKLP
ncbi:threonylcarbamoyl-AMP synthase [Candidatus Microgenomates bacterium]|nr:threonylcarbamoyl-AMP synthase [Candidatus Microgenomates bacterium]